MSDELNPATVKRTQNILGKYVKKPNLTEKLLKKPPFRFLHDVFNAVIRDTKCFVGLYTSEELTYENIKDRDAKMKFLQKMIDVVKLTTGSSLTVKTSKIVAGHEPEKTNELLQLMGEVIENKLDWQTAVEQVVSGKTARKESPRKSKDTNKVTKEIKSKEKSKEKELKTKEPKVIKTSGSKTTSREDKTKILKTKDKTTRKVVSKERTSNGNKESEKSGKRPGNEAPSVNSRLIKNESQASNKISDTLKAPEPKKELKSMQNKVDDCNHEHIEQQKENSKYDTTQRKLSTNSANTNGFSASNPNDLVPQSGNLEIDNSLAEISKKSLGKSQKPVANKSVEMYAEHVENKENKDNLEKDRSLTLLAQEKSEISEAGTLTSLKQDSIVSTDEQKQIKKRAEPDSLHKKQHVSLSSSPQKLDHKPLQSSPPISLSSEMKRETTFTRENSKESNTSSLTNRPRTSLRPPSARPPSARPGAPRRRDKNIEIILQPNDQIKMSGIQVKLETFGDLDDDGDNLVIIENSNANDVIDHHSNLNETEKIMQEEKLEQGHLVQQILETQKELVQQQNVTSGQEKNDKDSTNNSVMRQTSARHMNNLRDVIQNLTQYVNPLGKLMDFIPEDIDAMQLEFTLWRDTYVQSANELKREKSLTESAIEPMKNQLVQIEANIVEYIEMINTSRVKILQNYERITKLMTTS